MKYSLLKPKHLMVIIWWLFFKRYKIAVMEYWENKGMIDLFALEKAEKTTKQEYKKMIKKTDNETT